ncbi:MAG: hypothetical protein RIR79_238 [Pseudomonadota bacterium]|jgi:hypothetical protein
MFYLAPQSINPPQRLKRWVYQLASTSIAMLCLSTPAWAALTVNADGTVTDTVTSLVWDQCNYGRNNDAGCTGTAFLGTWQQALDAVAAANTASYKGFNDWRLPNKNELESITKIDTYVAGEAAIDTTTFPNTPISGDTWDWGGTWTSTTYAPYPSSAWIVYFAYGDTYADFKTDSYYVRLVRSGQSFASFDALASSQTITFSNPGTHTGNFALSASASSGLVVAFTSSSTGVCTVSGTALTVVSAGTCTINAAQAGNSSFNSAPPISQSFTVNVAAPPAPPPAPVVVIPTPPVTPIVPVDGSIGNAMDSGQELLIIAGTTVYAGSNGGQVQATGVAGVSTVAVTSGSMSIPCTIATAFCKTGQNILTVFAGESVVFAADGKVRSIQINPATPSSTIARLDGSNLMDAVIAALQTDNASLGTVTERTTDNWNTLLLGFASGKMAISAVVPMPINPTLPNSVKRLPNGAVQVVISGVIVKLVPSLLDAPRFAAALQTLNPPAEMRVNTDGTIAISYNRTTYILRPSMFTANADTSLFAIGMDGNLRFGNQSFAPAAYNFDQFSTMLVNLDATASVSIQTDGKLAVTIQGVTYILTPDYQVSIDTTFNQPDFAIRDGKLITHYQFGLTQGFTVGQ